MKPIDLEAIREREKKATKGPWKWHEDPGVKWDDPMDCGYDSRAPDRGAPYYCTGPNATTSEQASVDALFIAHARTDIPALLELVQAQTNALLIVEWGGDAEWCDVCKSHAFKHAPECRTDEVLTSVGFDTQEKRDAARKRLTGKR